MGKSVRIHFCDGSDPYYRFSENEDAIKEDLKKIGEMYDLEIVGKNGNFIYYIARRKKDGRQGR